MAVAIVGTPLAINDGTSYTAESGTDRVVVVAIGVEEFNSVTFAPTFGGQAFTQGVFIEGSDRSYAYIGYIKEADIPVGSNAFALNPSAAVDETDGTIFTLSGVDQMTVGSGATLDSPAATTRTLNLTGVADSVAVAVFDHEATGLIAADSNWATHNLGSGTNHKNYTASKTTAAGADTFEPSTGSAVDGVLAGFVFNAAPSNTTINVDIPADINLKWDTTHQLAVTHDGGTTTLDGVTLSTPTGWETVTYSGSLPAGDSFASLAATDATLGGGGYTMQAGDILAWETQTGLTVDVNTTPVVSPAATRTGSYKIWNEVGQTWTSVSTFTINDLGLNVGGGTIPVDDRVTFQAMVGYLITQGYQGAGNETIQKWLIAEGISKKSFNEMLRDYLTGLGYNGTLPEQLRDWRNG